MLTALQLFAQTMFAHLHVQGTHPLQNNAIAMLIVIVNHHSASAISANHLVHNLKLLLPIQTNATVKVVLTVYLTTVQYKMHANHNAMPLSLQDLLIMKAVIVN